jgi:fibronectin type 3 domain-containing protein
MATDDTIGEMYRVKQGTVHISYSAFANRANLGSIFIPKTVKAISDNAFLNCSALAFLFYESTVDDFNKINFNNNEYSLENTVVILEAAGTGTPAKPTVNSVTNIANGVQITWNAVDNADVYIVWRRGAGTSDWTMLGITDQTSVVDTSPTHRQYWRYSVQAMNADGFSDFDYTGKYLKYVATPKLTGISNATNGIYFKWNKVAGASGYRVYRRGAGGNWQYITTVKGTSYTDTAVKNQSGKYYRYTVRAVVDGRYSGYEDFLYTKRLANPKLTSATSGNGGITVKWNAISGTTGYYVYRKTANSGWKHVGTCYGTKTTAFLDKTAAKGTTYTYTVRAVYGKTTSYFDSGIKCKR